MLQGSGWVLVFYLIIAQGIPAFDYQIGVRMGTQRSAAAITNVVAVFGYGFAYWKCPLFDGAGPRIYE